MAIIKNPITVISGGKEEQEFIKGIFENTIEDLVIPEYVDTCVLGGWLRSNNCSSLKSLYVPGNCKIIGGFSWNNNLKTVVLEEGVESFGDAFLYQSKVEGTLVIPDSAVNWYGRWSFTGMNITKLVLGMGLFKNLINGYGMDMFSQLPNLTTIIYPSDITTGNAFYRALGSGCPNVKYVDFRKAVRVFNIHGQSGLNSSTYGVSYLGTDTRFIVPFSLYDSWTTATTWATLPVDMTQSIYAVWVAAYDAETFDDIPSADRITGRYYILMSDTEYTNIKKWNGTSWEDLV